MNGHDTSAKFTALQGPLASALSAVMGLLAGAGLVRVVVPVIDPNGNPVVTLTMVIPFVTLLALIALMPLLAKDLWHRHFPGFSLGLGGLVAGYYIFGFGGPGLSVGLEKVLHALLDFYSFIALVGGLYVVSGTILIDLKGRATPLRNTLLLAAGAILANFVGTTGASVLLIRPFMRLNEGRVRPIHVVLFIFIVSNCGGCVLPIGDPPLYLGFLKGVPFLWTLFHLWPDWLATVLPLLAVFYVIDLRLNRRQHHASDPPPTLTIRGKRGIVCLVLMVIGVLIDPLLERLAGISGVPIGATLQLAVACVAYNIAPRPILDANEFSFFPVKEVGLLFAGIFLTMIPALGYMSAHGARLGLDSPTSYYFSTGVLSAFLDNAPTYLNFLQVAVAPGELSSATIHPYLATPDGLLFVRAISTGAVFFGAMTYIGNGPNFMVHAIVESAGIKMPSFFAYIGWAVVILLPILAFHWAILIR
jgi:Na+/H+ antiporter NhaD/arsenite permease-like protein